jgi:hypothetical protein
LLANIGFIGLQKGECFRFRSRTGHQPQRDHRIGSGDSHLRIATAACQITEFGLDGGFAQPETMQQSFADYYPTRQLLLQAWPNFFFPHGKKFARHSGQGYD